MSTGRTEIIFCADTLVEKSPHYLLFINSSADYHCCDYHALPEPNGWKILFYSQHNKSTDIFKYEKLQILKVPVPIFLG